MEPPAKKLKSKNLVLPNKNEQLSLQNTEILLKSNFMKMQLTELLSNVHNSETTSKYNKISKWLDEISDALKACDKSVNDCELSGKWLTERNLHGFFMEGPESDIVSLSFQKPAAVQTVGSFALGTTTSPILNCDIVVTMPKNCFEARYFCVYVNNHISKP